MKAALKVITFALSGIRLIPHAVLFILSDKNGPFRADVRRWAQVYPGARDAFRPLCLFVELMTLYPEFRYLSISGLG